MTLLVLALLSCWRSSLTRETRHAEQLMGLERHEIVFELLPRPLCGEYRWAQWLGRYGIVYEPTFVYSTHDACRNYPPRKLAMHEVAHARMQHHAVTLSSAEREREAEACVRWYSREDRRASVSSGLPAP